MQTSKLTLTGTVKLTVEDSVIAFVTVPVPACREKLVAQGRSNVDAVRQVLEKEQKVNEIKALHLKAACWDIMAVPAAQILPVGQISLNVGLADYEPTEEMRTRFAAWKLAPVHNMPITRLLEAETHRLEEACEQQAQQCALLDQSGIFM